eukprot:scaffold1953_cov176-Amphora_coffeaeformis.AAC.5
MKPSRAAIAMMASTATAFTVGTRGSFVGSRSAAALRSSLAPQRGRWPAGGVTMLLGNFFGGGAFESKIDYSKLEFPGPELATAAEQGQVLVTSPTAPELAVASVAGGCFWGVELAFQRVPGVKYTAVGYTQGMEEYPTYNNVCAGATGHTEGLIVYYDPKECSYESLLDAFFNFVNPTTVNGQGMDYGRQYRTGVYYHTPEQEAIARKRFEEEQAKYSRPIATELKPAMPFWPAEDYHQQYLEKGGRFGQAQDASKGATDPIRCYG